MKAAKKMGAGYFKAHCLKVMDEVHSKRQSVIITKRGKPIAKLVPVSDDPDDIFDFMAGKGSIAGDVVSPAFSPEEWGE